MMRHCRACHCEPPGGRRGVGAARRRLGPNRAAVLWLPAHDQGTIPRRAMRCGAQCASARARARVCVSAVVVVAAALDVCVSVIGKTTNGRMDVCRMCGATQDVCRRVCVCVSRRHTTARRCVYTRPRDAARRRFVSSSSSSHHVCSRAPRDQETTPTRASASSRAAEEDRTTTCDRYS